MFIREHDIKNREGLTQKGRRTNAITNTLNPLSRKREM